MTDDPRLRALVASLEGSTLGSDDLIRFTMDSGDDRVADLVQSSELYDVDSRATLRTLMTPVAEDSLYLFAQRRVLSGRRTSNPNHCRQALSALSLLPTVDDVPWTTWFLAALLLGEFAADTSIVTLFEGPATAGGFRCRSLQRSLLKGGSLAQCHLVEVSTTYGVGIVELPRPRDVPARGWLDAPLIDKDDALYAPTMNLAQLAVNVADALDHLDATRTSALQFSLLSTGTSPFIRTLGCLHCCAITESATMDVFVAQLADASDAKQFQANLSVAEGTAVCAGDRVVLFMEQPRFDGREITSYTDLAPYIEAARQALLLDEP